MGWTQYAPVGGAALALVLAALIRVARRRGTREDIDISPTMLGYLTGGVRRAVITAIAMLHVRGAVRVGRPGTVKHADGRFASTDRLLAATYAAIYQPNGPSGIMARPQVRRAETEVRRELVAAGLLVPTGNWLAFRWLTWLSGPLLAAQLATSHSAMSIGLVVVVFVVGGLLYGRDRRTRTARARTRQLGRQSGTDATSIGYTVAKRGKRALRELMPRFAKDAGLLDGGVAATNHADTTIGPNPNIWSA